MNSCPTGSGSSWDLTNSVTLLSTPSMFPSGSPSSQHGVSDNTDENWLHSSTYSSGFVPQRSVQDASKDVDQNNGIRSDRHRSKRSRTESHRKKVVLDNKAIFLEDVPGLDMLDAFRIDRTSNREIYTHGCIYEKQVSRFVPKDRITIIGFRSLRRCDLLDPNATQPLKKVKRFRYFSKNNRSVLAKPGLDLATGDMVQEGTLLLELSIPDEVYTSVPPMPKSAYVLSLCEELNRAVYDKPNDLNSWLKLIDLQAKEAAFLHVESAGEGAVNSSEEPATVSTVNNRLLILNKQHSMIERALNANPGCLGLKILVIRMSELATEFQTHAGSSSTRLAGELFQPEKIGREWAQLAFTFPQLVPIWRGYISHLTGKYAAFQPVSVTQTVGSGLFSRIDGIYRRGLSTLSGIISGRILSHRPHLETAEQTIDFLADYCHWLVQAGHAERALAVWQAVIEFSCFRPSELDEHSFEQSVLEMELFWSSGAPRFGQPGSENWCGWHKRERKQGISGDRHRKKGNTPAVGKQATRHSHLVEELSSDSTVDELRSKWSEVVGNLKSIASTCEDALIHCSADLIADESQQKLGPDIVPSVLSSDVEPDQWTRRGAAPSLTGNASVGKSRAVLYRRGKAWVGLERAREAVGWLPSDVLSHPGDPETAEDEDPERLVLFDDVKPCLLELHNLSEKNLDEHTCKRTRKIRLQQRLLLHCLEFLGAYDSSVSLMYHLPSDLHLVHDLASLGPIQRHELSPFGSRPITSSAVEEYSGRGRNHQPSSAHQDTWMQARRCFLDAALAQASHVPRWGKEFRTKWIGTLGRLRFQVALDRLLNSIRSLQLDGKVISSAWRHCGRSIMAQAENQQDLYLWQAYASGFWQAALLVSSSGSADSVKDAQNLISESRRIFDTALTSYPIPSEVPSSCDISQSAIFHSQKLAPRLQLLQRYVDLELGVFPGTGDAKYLLGSEARALQLLVQAAVGGQYNAPDLKTPPGPSAFVKAAHAYGKRVEVIWHTLVSLSEVSQLDSAQELLVDGLTKSVPVLAYLSFLFDLLTTDQQCLTTSFSGLLSVLHRIDRIRSQSTESQPGKSDEQNIRNRTASSSCSSADDLPSALAQHHRICSRQFLVLCIGGVSAFCALRQRNRRPLLECLFELWTKNQSHCTLPVDLLLPSRLAYLLPARVALERRLLPLSLASASTCHGLLPPMFLTHFAQQLHQFSQEISELAANSVVQRIVSGSRASTQLSTLDSDKVALSEECDLVLRGAQLESYANCFPAAADLFLLSLELERWTSLLAGVSASADAGGAHIRDTTSDQRVRNAFERAVRATPSIAPLLSDRGDLIHIALASSTPSFWSTVLRLVVWRAYMAFGWMSGSNSKQSSSINSSNRNVDPRQRRQAVKAIFYRAIEDLPWAKVLYTDLVRYCPEDVEEVVDLLSERELRLRTPLEEVDLLLTARPVTVE
ncbi:unnamed protein product [Calicophoron daubneyi]|uniref:Uncharacterized protein n=1 Tax=Calicophoron daubneyi TaxID=300641 RepID=A0AAV2TI14_CALDB